MCNTYTYIYIYMYINRPCLCSFPSPRSSGPRQLIDGPRTGGRLAVASNGRKSGQVLDHMITTTVTLTIVMIILLAVLLVTMELIMVAIDHRVSGQGSHEASRHGIKYHVSCNNYTRRVMNMSD